MTHPVYASERTALLLVDPYNDFLSDGGKLYSMLRSVADEVRLLDNLRTTVAAARAQAIQVYYVPHRRWQPGDYTRWDHPNPTQRLIQNVTPLPRGPGAANGILTSCHRRAISSSRTLGTKRVRQYRPRLPA